MTTVSEMELARTLEQLQAQMAELAKRMERLEGQGGAPWKWPRPAVETERAAGITEEEYWPCRRPSGRIWECARTYGRYGWWARARGRNRGVCRFRRRIVCMGNRRVAIPPQAASLPHTAVLGIT